MGKIIIFILIGIFLFLVLPFLILSIVLYRHILVKKTAQTWARGASMPFDPEYVRMFDIGRQWHEVNKDRKEDLTISNDGFFLAAEYYNFGYDKAVIIIPGRTETCEYSYFFAEPFKKAGCNVLAIDNRSHGLSQGKRCCLGYKEYRDIIAWGKYLNSERNINTVIVHGICIGASTGLFALTSPDCPSFFKGLITEGMYTNFSESFKWHMIEGNHKLFPLFYLTMLQIRVFSGADVMFDGPFKRIKNLQTPALFMHGKEDQYSLFDDSMVMYHTCPGEHIIEVFDKGKHSRLRINETEHYDTAIINFLLKIS